VASGTDEALRLARASHYDLAIVDYYLGSENGGELVSQLRAEFGVSVVTMSVGGAEARQHMLAAGADLHLDKPVALGDLFFTIEQMAGEASGCGSES
jgi:DNA-binding response OmpR family regulator